jgi:hypothetical protein
MVADRAAITSDISRVLTENVNVICNTASETFAISRNRPTPRRGRALGTGT